MEYHCNNDGRGLIGACMMEWQIIITALHLNGLVNDMWVSITFECYIDWKVTIILDIFAAFVYTRNKLPNRNSAKNGLASAVWSGKSP
jgi:hypothetical protein